MPLTLLRQAALEVGPLLNRNPPDQSLALSAQMAHVYLWRLPNFAKAIELLSVNRMPVEARTVARGLVETVLKLGYMLQHKVEGAEPANNDMGDRERLALDVWDLERIEDAKMITGAAPHTSHFEAEFLKTVADARARFAARVTQKNLAEMADAAGMANEYRLAFGPMSSDAHGSIAAARRSATTATDADIRSTLTFGARYALILLDVASELLGDKTGKDRALELGRRLRDLP